MDLSKLRLGNAAYLYSASSHLETPTLDQFIGRRRFCDYFQHEVSNSPNIYYNDPMMANEEILTGTTSNEKSGGGHGGSTDFRLLKIDDQLRRRIWLSQLTAARM